MRDEPVKIGGRKDNSATWTPKEEAKGTDLGGGSCNSWPKEG